MVSHHSGSKPIVSIESSEFTLWISEASNSKVPDCSGDGTVSKISMSGNEYSVEILGENYENLEGYVSVPTVPLFFEQRSYQFILIPKNDTNLEITHQDRSLDSRFIKMGKQCAGVVNFGNSIGHTKFSIESDGIRLFSFEIEIFPSKIRYKEDYLAMREDISREVYNLIFEFLDITYQKFNSGNRAGNSLAEYHAILRNLFDNLIRALNRVMAQPHHKMECVYELVPDYKIKSVDTKSRRWLEKHPELSNRIDYGGKPVKLLAPKKQITYDTAENRFVKFVMVSIVKKITKIQELYSKKKSAQDTYVGELIRMKMEISSKLHNSFLIDLNSEGLSNSMSLVFAMAPGYKEVYRYYQLLTHSLDINGEIFNISVKNIAQLYEYWCFIKLYSMLKEEYPLHTQSLLSIDSRGLTIQLRKGKESCIVMRKKDSDESITIMYNRVSESCTVPQIPDNILKISKKGRGNEGDIQYVFDAKYRIDPAEPGSEYCKYGGPGPVIDTINTMHRYRDAIVYSNSEHYSRQMVGAFVLFPYGGDETEYRKHKFYKSIDEVNIGGIPFLPGKTELLKELLDKLIINPSEFSKKRFVRAESKWEEWSLEPDY